VALTMNAEECRQGCCGVSCRRNVSDCFDRGLRRNRAEPFEIEGEKLTDANGLDAQFSLRLEGGRIEAVRFRVTSCVALTAYAEVLAEEAEKLSLTSALAITPRALNDLLEGVPLFRRDRANLAVAALRSAIQSATLHQSGIPNESRLHLRHATA
jgi:NifU-like protein involved in Fe-S cluster formation